MNLQSDPKVCCDIKNELKTPSQPYNGIIQSSGYMGAIKTYPSRYACTKSPLNSREDRKYVNMRQYLGIQEIFPLKHSVRI